MAAKSGYLLGVIVISSLTRDGLLLSAKLGADLLSGPIWSERLVGPKAATRPRQAIPRQCCPIVGSTIRRILRGGR